TIWYYDSRLGVRTAVAATGLTLGGGEFGGYYAINSEYVVIPAIVFSQMRGSRLHIYYSHDGGRNFKSFLWGGYFSGRYSREENVIILNGKDLYIARKSRDEPVHVYSSSLYDVSRDIPVSDDRSPVDPKNYRIDPHLVPLTIKSPSGKIAWSCTASADLK
ncbi:T6SS immunity protein Tli3 family protein, partial [Burkholderia ubonensis]